MTEHTEDDTFAKLRNMQFDEALDLAIELSSQLPLGSSREARLAFVEYELKRFGWSYERMNAEYKRRNGEE